MCQIGASMGLSFVSLGQWLRPCRCSFVARVIIAAVSEYTLTTITKDTDLRAYNVRWHLVVHNRTQVYGFDIERPSFCHTLTLER